MIKVLVVDDEQDFLKITKMNLEDTGRFSVETLFQTKDIIPTVHSFHPDVILLDILMPGVGGIEACQMLNDDPVGGGTPIIILSALDKEQDKKKAFRLGVVDYLVKPVEKSEIISRIEKAVKLKQGGE